MKISEYQCFAKLIRFGKDEISGGYNETGNQNVNIENLFMVYFVNTLNIQNNLH